MADFIYDKNFRRFLLVRDGFYSNGQRVRRIARSMKYEEHEEFTGFITTLANFGFFVELDEYFVEGLVKLSSLIDDDYDYYEKEYIIKGRRHGRKFRLGDNVRVKVVRINAFRSEIDFELVSTGNGKTSKR